MHGSRLGRINLPTWCKCTGRELEAAGELQEWAVGRGQWSQAPGQSGIAARENV